MIKEILGWLFKPAQPDSIYVFLEDDMSELLRYRVLLPLVKDITVAKRELSIVVDGGEAQIQMVPAKQPDVVIEVAEESDVKLTLSDMDKRGNRSFARTFEFASHDTIPPRQPGEVHVELLAEVAVDEDTGETQETVLDEPQEVLEVPPAPPAPSPLDAVE